ncbi:MAG: acyl-CoA dehydrogenase family protein [Pseudomonadota bacterium]|uniref:Acyl-CoA dehydrogenase n=1 Tax=marine metagenome TaxID=408172 RepID=A0A381P7N7_9ZZZZ|nr:acyl-CoA dehydrogenase [Gammaproteobacteria bacterium]MEC8833921.1 acyl-CoA dehydrogenase family protein [Pseudomonadota bacterium]MEC8868850.1 acyl-CoA dehydrogenase family protein [Pseudomonadota bacterium]MEC9240176.1 acyl-CoA dehydrogenase family protein [Pseudomonadota bacterium]MEC9286145.1 acyl-CoA dehydrogenase family protein [Pseudomonadota bacterium]|tara:strand:+ start:1353 stop:2519 length:1167 start_codon:yes stop_codon:yes gene_type:complete
MDFETTDEHQLIRDAIGKICTDFPDEYWSKCDSEHLFPWDFYNALAEAGWIGIAIPEQYGGSGRGITEASIVLEEVAASGAAMNGASGIHLSIFGMHPVVKYGSEEMKQKYLPRVAAGDLHIAFGVTEPDAGTDTTSIKTTARLDGDQYLVKGRKVWTTKALDSERVLLLVRTESRDAVAKRTEGMTLLLAELQRPEVTISPIDKVGRNAVASCEVVYDDLPVHQTDRVGEEGKGFRYLLDGLNAERILVAAEALGIGRAAMRRAVSYAKEREIFGRPIGQNQGVSFPLGEAQMRLDAAELMIRKASWLLDHGEPCGAEANMAKWLAADAAFQAADQAIQTHGGFGYAREYHVERYWREARLMRIAPISQEMILNYVTEHVLELPRSY